MGNMRDAGFSALMDDIFVGFQASYTKGFAGAASTYKTIAMDTTSTGESEKYPFATGFANLREWAGDRVIRNLSTYGFAIENVPFESTIGVPRAKIEDDKYGIYAPFMEEMGKAAAQHPDRMVYSLLSKGFATKCYDDCMFFADNHQAPDGTGGLRPQSNMQDGDGPMWVLVDGSQPIKPMVFQTRRPYEFHILDSELSDRVFMRDEFLYGIRARVAAGFALWQLAFASKAPLTPENYEKARAAMAGLKKENGDKLGVRATHLIVPDELEGPGRRLLKSDIRPLETAGQVVPVSNEWKDTAELIVAPYL
jgi:phage major head subunit gpT-like protein